VSCGTSALIILLAALGRLFGAASALPCCALRGISGGATMAIEALVGFGSPLVLRPGFFLCTLDYEPASLYIRNIIPDDMGIPLPEHLVDRGGAMRYSPNVMEEEFCELRLQRFLRTSHKANSANFVCRTS
jgi:hypothetical protein